MTINRVLATYGAPVLVPGLSPLVGYNIIWVEADGGERVTVTASAGAQLLGANGQPSGSTGVYTANAAGWIVPPVRVCFPSEHNDEGQAVLEISGATGGALQILLSFLPLLPGPGRFRWIGSATGAPSGPDAYCMVFLDIDQTVNGQSMPVGALRAWSGNVTFPDFPSSGPAVIFPLDAGCAAVRVQAPLAGILRLNCSIPNSPDGEISAIGLLFQYAPQSQDQFARMPG